ncbi:IS66 family insertion sequence element accessory protein TnpB [Acinetobacter baumannii]|uniref:IS66 family insertion sequence element accessory protein TnpB n=1 Tax=Acinetobacter baumannii TaxID=470 RepID=UPI0039B5A391
MASGGERAFGYIKPHCAYLFCNKRGHRMKVLVHDGLGIWLCARRLNRKIPLGAGSPGERLASVRNSYRH